MSAAAVSLGGYTLGGVEAPAGTVSIGGGPRATGGSIAPRQRALSLALTTPAYHAAGNSQELAGFHPQLRPADAEVIPSRDKIVARSRDIDRNNGVIAGGIERRADAVVGQNIWLKCRPDFVAMGQTAEWADAWSINVESHFRVWANSSRFLNDVERDQQFGGQVNLAYLHYVREGEGAAPIYWIDDRGGMFSTAVLILDPDRISNPDGKADNDNLKGGIALDRYGAAIGYWVRNSHPGESSTSYQAQRWTYCPRESETGRPLFVHVKNKRRAHQRRSIGRLASVMARIQMQGLADKAELQSAITNAIFGLYATTKRSSDEMAESMSPIEDGAEDIDTHRADFYERADLTFGGVRVATVPDGDKIETIANERATENYVSFQNYILRAIASALGISYEQLSNDWSGINYSSARTLLNEIWRGLIADRHAFTQQFCTPIFAAWLEEAVARGLVDVPGGKQNFYRFRDALTQCEWIGPGRGKIDPKKEAEAGKIERDNLVSTLEQDCADDGRDWRQTLWQAKREQVLMEEYGLTQAPPAGSSPGRAAVDDTEETDVKEAA